MTALGTWANGSRSLALVVVAVAGAAVCRLRPSIRQLMQEAGGASRALPLYLIGVPMATLGAHMAVAGPATTFSRTRAMEKARDEHLFPSHASR